MVENLFAWIFTVTGVVFNNPLWAVAGGLFAIATNLYKTKNNDLV